MSNGKGGRGKDQKVPSRVIDLKATEVRGSETAKGSKVGTADSGASGQSAQTSVPKAGATPTGTAAALAASKATGARGAAPAGTGGRSATAQGTASGPAGGTSQGGSAAGVAAAASGTGGSGRSGGGSGSGGSGSNGSGGANEPERVVIRERRGPGFLGTLTHLVAGFIGGGIVLYGGEQIRALGQQAGLQLPQPAVSVPESLENRIASLEQSTSGRSDQAATEQLGERIAALEAKAGTLDSLAQEITALKTAQAELAQNAANGGGSGDGQSAGDGATSEQLATVAGRIDKIEQTLATLSRAAGPDGTSGGRLAQVAALSGRLTALESALKTQVESLRTSVLNEVDQRITPATTASEAARTGTERVDREVADLRNEAARLKQTATNLQSELKQLDNEIRAASDQAATIATQVKDLRGDFDQEIKKVARPADVKTAVAPIDQKVTALQTDVSQIKSEAASRKASGERIVLALQLSNLKRALDRGSAYAAELADVKSLADRLNLSGDGVDFSALEGFKDKGVATVPALLSEFRSLSFDMIQAGETDKSANWMDKLVSGAKSIVQVRRTGSSAEVDPNSLEGIVATIEQELRAGRISAAVAAAEKLPPPSKKAAGQWLTQLKARGAVDAAIATIESNLKGALTSANAPAEKG